MKELRTVCLNLSVRGFLRNNRFPRDYKGVFTGDDGKALEPEAAREGLMDHLAAGRERIPVDATCANPCPRAGRGCTGFDFGADGGCPGYYKAAAGCEG